MSIITYFSSRLRRGRRKNPGEPGKDPLSHPALAAMTLRELADLPLSARDLDEPPDDRHRLPSTDFA